jgi:hypothetical protein
VDIARVSFSGVDLLLETDRNGVGNWVMSGPAGAQAAPAGGSSSPLRIQLSRIALADARLAYRDARSGVTHSLLLQALELDAAGDGHRLDARFDVSGQPWQLKGQVGSLAELSANQADWPFDLQLGSDGALLVAKGLLRRGALPCPIEADLQARLTRAEALSPWLTHAARVPLPIELKGRLSYAAQSLRIHGLKGLVAQQQMNGQLKPRAPTRGRSTRNWPRRRSTWHAGCRRAWRCRRRAATCRWTSCCRRPAIRPSPRAGRRSCVPTSTGPATPRARWPPAPMAS